MTNEKKIELTSCIAEKIVENQMGIHMVWEDREDCSEGFTEEAQDLFNEINDIVESVIKQNHNI